MSSEQETTAWDVVSVSGRRYRDRMKEYSDSLGEPDIVVTGDDDFAQEVGYWRVSGGVLSHRKRKDGIWDKFSREEYPDSVLDLLGKLYQQEPAEGR